MNDPNYEMTWFYSRAKIIKKTSGAISFKYAKMAFASSDKDKNSIFPKVEIQNPCSARALILLNPYPSRFLIMAKSILEISSDSG
jgi:hypothetical protein